MDFPDENPGSSCPGPGEYEIVAVDRLKALVEAMENLMGLYDTPLERHKRRKDAFYNEAIEIARTALRPFRN